MTYLPIYPIDANELDEWGYPPTCSIDEYDWTLTCDDDAICETANRKSKGELMYVCEAHFADMQQSELARTETVALYPLNHHAIAAIRANIDAMRTYSSMIERSLADGLIDGLPDNIAHSILHGYNIHLEALTRSLNAIALATNQVVDWNPKHAGVTQ